MNALFVRRTVLVTLVGVLFALFSYARLVAQVEDQAAELLPPEAAAEETVVEPIVEDEEVIFEEEPEQPMFEEGFLDETEAGFPAEEPSTLEITDTGNVTIDFVDADVKDVLRAFSYKTGVNVVAGDEIKGSVTIRLVNVPWEQALQLILEAKSYAYVKEANVVKVLTQEAMQNEPIEIEVLRLKYAKAGDVAPTVEHVLKDRERGSVQFDERSNSLIVSDVRSNIPKIQDIVGILDAQTPQVYIETKIVETSNQSMKDLGINWTSLSAYTIGASNLQRDYREVRSDANLKAQGGVDVGLTSRGDSYLRTSGDLASRSFGSNTAYDGTNTVMSSSRARGTSADESRSYSSSRTSANTTVNGNLRGTGITDIEFDAEKGTLTMESVVDKLVTEARTAVLSASDFAIVLSALQRDTDVKLVSNPNIVVSDNQEAEITIGEEYPIPRYQFNEDTATLEVSGFDYKNIGIILRVTPHINPDGYVTLDVAPEVSSRGASVPFGGSVGTEIPIINSRKARTRVLIKDGYTLSIGGLVTEDENNVYTKVPLLGDIPWAGRLFRHESLKKVQKNIIIFLTTNLISPDSGTPPAEKIDVAMATPAEPENVATVHAAEAGILPARVVEERETVEVDIEVEPAMADTAEIPEPAAGAAVPAGTLRPYRGPIGGVRR